MVPQNTPKRRCGMSIPGIMHVVSVNGRTGPAGHSPQPDCEGENDEQQSMLVRLNVE